MMHPVEEVVSTHATGCNPNRFQPVQGYWLPALTRCTLRGTKKKQKNGKTASRVCNLMSDPLCLESQHWATTILGLATLVSFFHSVRFMAGLTGIILHT